MTTDEDYGTSKIQNWLRVARSSGQGAIIVGLCGLHVSLNDRRARAPPPPIDSSTNILLSTCNSMVCNAAAMSTPVATTTPLPASAKTPHFALSPQVLDVSTPASNTNAPPTSTTSHPPFKELTPQTFDILPPLHEILSRVLATSSNNSSLPFASPTASGGAHAYPGSQPLEVKDLVQEVASVRARIRRAREACEGVEWANRELEDLREEESWLRERVERMRAELGMGRGLESGEEMER